VRRGQIWWTDIGEPSGSEPGYRRPAVIVSGNKLNDTTIRTVIVAFLTTSARRDRELGVIRIAARATGLPKDSFVNLTQIYTLDRRALQSLIGRVPDGLMADIDRGLRFVLAL
jgi:mRNA interferase MazF